MFYSVSRIRFMVEGFCVVVCVWRRVGGFLTAPSRPQAVAAVRAHHTRFLHHDQGRTYTYFSNGRGHMQKNISDNCVIN